MDFSFCLKTKTKQINLGTWSPSFVQNTDGGGFPVAEHSNLAMPFSPTLWSRGVFRNKGRAVNKHLMRKEIIQ